MTDWNLNRRFAAGVILIAPAIAALLLITDSFSPAPSSPTAMPDGVALVVTEVNAAALTDNGYLDQQESPTKDSTLRSIRQPLLIGATSIAPLQRALHKGSERWYYQRFAAKIGADTPAFRRELAAILAASGPLAERVAGLQAWHDAKAEPALEPFDQVLRSTEAKDPLHAFVLRLLSRDGSSPVR